MKPASLGIYTPEIKAASPEELFRKISGFGFTQVQFDFLSVGQDEMPESVPEELLAGIESQAALNGVAISVINGTFNMAHPDQEVRGDGVNRFRQIAMAAKRLGCPNVSLCTGSRSRGSMWAPHADNATQAAWNDMVDSMEKVVDIAEAYGLSLLIEPEASNVCGSAQKVRQLIDSMGSGRLKVIMDCANLFQEGMAHRDKVRDVIRNGFDLLGGFIAAAHGKDILEGSGIAFTYAGNGIVDFEFFMRELDKIGFGGGMILHGTKSEGDLPSAIRHIRSIESRI